MTIDVLTNDKGIAFAINPAPIDARGADLAAEVLKAIAADPEKHKQSDWGTKTACGTTMCVAGWTTWLTGEAGFRQSYLPEEQFLNVIDTDSFVEERAKELLGLSDDDAERLFYYMNNDGARAALEYIAAGEKIDWRRLYTEFPDAESSLEDLDD